MTNSKAPKPSKDPQDIDSLKSDIASFASTLGLSSSIPSSGFNDSDFRKSGPLNKTRNKTPKENNQKLQSKEDSSRRPKPNTFNKNNEKSKFEQRTDKTQKPGGRGSSNNQILKPKPPVLSLDDDSNNTYAKRFDKYKNLPKVPLVKANLLGPEWYKDAEELEKKVFGGVEKNMKSEVKNVQEWKGVVEKKKEFGERLMWQYTQDFDSSKGKSGDMKMVMAAQKAGTEADKVTAFEIMVGENPIANMRSLDALLGMVTSKVGKRYAFKGFNALRELFIKLLPDRKLKMLLQRPVNNLPETKDGFYLLLLWYWEECLKHRYERFVLALDEASRDMLPQLKDKALKTMYELLSSKPEQERRLLSSLVNKLGDPQSKSASTADFHISNLISDHPNMKAVVIDEVDSFLFRPHLTVKGKYHAVNLLTQIRLGHKGDGPKVAKRLIDIYFALFKVLVTAAGGQQQVDKDKRVGDKKAHGSKEKKPESSSDSHVELDSRLLSALLTGVNRAFPYVASEETDDIIEVHTPVLFQLVHSKNFNVGVQALMLLDKISSKNQIVSDRFYRALYSKLLLPAAMNSSKAEMFIGLLLRTMKSDVNLKRVSAFAKRLLQVSLQQPPQYACGCLFLLSEVLKARPQLWNMVLQNESADEDLEHFEDVTEEDKTDDVTVEEKKEGVTKEDKTKLTTAEETKEEAEYGHEAANSDNDSSEEDDNLPASDSDDEGDNSDEADELVIRDQDHQKSKEVSPDNTQKPKVPSTRTFLPGGYNPQHREPTYCNANRASWWELMVLATHVHPSVATMAGTLLSGANIVYNGNPLNDLSLTAFLDKFMEKKPKASTWHGASQIEPAKKLEMTNNLIGSEILSLAEMDVAPEDLVFHKFYINKMNSSKKSKKKKKKTADDEAAEDLFEVDGGGDDDDESGDDVDGGDESDNEEIENMLDSVNPSMEADGDYDYDDLDEVAYEDDDDLVVDASDAEMDDLSDTGLEEGFDASDGEDGDLIDIGDIDDGIDGEDGLSHNKKKRKKASASPFASLDEYEHLINKHTPAEKEAPRDKKPKSRKKKKSSK